MITIASLLLLSSIVTASVAQASLPIGFSRTSIWAVSSVSIRQTALYAYPSLGRPQSAQFFYIKLMNSSASNNPLAAVVLKNDDLGISQLLTEGFDVLGQMCSCYALDAQQLVSRYPSLQGINSARFYLQIAGGSGERKFNQSSGFFTLLLDQNSTTLRPGNRKPPATCQPQDFIVRSEGSHTVNYLPFGILMTLAFLWAFQSRQ